MSKTTDDFLEYINESDMRVFETVSSKRKAQIVYKNFQNYEFNKRKMELAKREEEKDAYALHVDRFWIIASKQLNSLSEEELTEYLKLVQSEMSKSMKMSKTNEAMLQVKLRFGTIIRRLPSNLTQEQLTIKSEMEGVLSSYFVKIENEM